MRRTSRLIPLVLALVVGLGVYLAAQQGAGGAGHERLLASSGRGTPAVGRPRHRHGARAAKCGCGRSRRTAWCRGRSHERLDQYLPRRPRGRRRGGARDRRAGDAVGDGVGLLRHPRRHRSDAVARRRGRRSSCEETGATSAPRAAPELVILPKDDQHASCWPTASPPSSGHEMPVVFVNAKTGGVELRYNNLQLPAGDRADRQRRAGQPGARAERPEEGRVRPAGQHVPRVGHGPPDRHQDVRHEGQPDAGEGHLRRQRSPLLPSDMATNTGSTWTDPVVVDAHTYVGWTYDYFYTRHGWKGLNNLDTPHRLHPRALGEPRRLHEVLAPRTRAPTTPTRSSAAGAAPTARTC